MKRAIFAAITLACLSSSPALAWVNKFSEDRPAACAAIWASFGDDGDVLPGILRRK